MKRRYPLAVFLGAFLLFLVQPMAGKQVLPRFGGGPSVWTACMLFFQLLLLAGYAYAHALTALPRRTQGWLHSALLVISLCSLPLFVSHAAWTSHAGGAEDPVRAILLVLAGAVGLPYFLLSSTGPLLQAWFYAEQETGTSPYRLYALSNVASFLALLLYPVLVEPWLALRTQSLIWAAMFALYAATMAYSALAGRAAEARPKLEDASEPISPLTFLFWLILAACGSTILLAATNHICQEVAVIPFLWVLPLSLYLLTFVLCFDSEGWYNRRIFGLLTAGAVAASCYLMSLETPPPIWRQALADLVIVAAGCMICHGELSRSKPAPAKLTQFYLTLSAGGALGGVFTALIAPRIFHGFTEFPLSMAVCCLLAVIGWTRGGVFSKDATTLQIITHSVAAVALLAAAGGAIFTASRKPEDSIIYATRNFFGVLRVATDTENDGQVRKLTHGRTLHGLQFQDAERRVLPTTYYGPDSGVGVAIENHPTRLAGQPLRLGMIGLGTGTIAAYGKLGDTLRFYEINPSVDYISQQYFSYRKDSGAMVDVVLGDARVKLEEQAARGESQRFDVLAVDAFSSDAIPVHLLTAECAQLYKYHLKPDGLLVLHISNRWLDLKPPSRGLAESLGWRAGMVDTDDESGPGIRSSTWIIVSTNAPFFAGERVQKVLTPWGKDDKKPLLWRDDFTSLWPVFTF